MIHIGVIGAAGLTGRLFIDLLETQKFTSKQELRSENLRLWSFKVADS